MQIQTTKAIETEQIGEALGRNLRGGEVIELVGDLGSGKTTFTRGLARGIGSLDNVSSPTFTISKVYKSKPLEIHHFDLYRLQEAGLIEHELAEIADDDNSVIVVEWAEIAAHVLPKKRLIINFSHTGEDQRTLNFSFSKNLEYLVKNLPGT